MPEKHCWKPMKNSNRHYRAALMALLAAVGIGAVADQSPPNSDAADDVATAVTVDLVVLPSVSFQEDSSFHVQYRIGPQQIIVRAEDGIPMVVEIDGTVVPDDRLRRIKGKLIILDENGNEIQSLHLFKPINRELMFRMMGGLRRPANSFEFGIAGNQELSWVGDLTTMDVEFSPPSVMLGIYTEETSPALEKHLGLDIDTTVTITGLHVGLPAQEVGLEEYDIILSIDGRQPVSKQVIFETLKQKTPGEALELNIIQAGETKSFTVTLEKFDPQRRRATQIIGRVPYRFGGRPRHRHGRPSMGFNPSLAGVLVTPDSRDIFRFGPEGIDDNVHFEIRSMLRKLSSLEEGSANEEILKLEIQLDDVHGKLEEIRRKSETKDEGKRP